MTRPPKGAQMSTQINPWAMTAEQFNNWRKQNDIPTLLKFMKTRWKQFNEWQKEYGITDEALLGLMLTHFIRFSEGPRYAYKIEKEGKQEWKDFVDERTDTQFEIPVGQKYSDGSIVTERVFFVPYEKWAAAKKITIIESDRNISPTTWDYQGAMLRGGFRLLKLGGTPNAPIRITTNEIAGRNLDFADLDNIIFDKASGSTFKSVVFSSFRNSAFIRNSYFWRFQSTTLSHAHEGGLKLIDGTYQDFHFKRMIIDLDASNTRLLNCSFTDCIVRPIFRDKTRLENCKVSFSQNYRGANLAANTLKSFRDQYSEQRDSETASSLHYEYKKQIEKTYFFPLYYQRNALPGYGFGATWQDVLDSRKYGTLSNEQLRKFLRDYLFSRIIWLRSPKTALRVLGFLAAGIASVLSRFAWGYGTKPTRTICFGIVVILIYAAIYYTDTASITYGDATYSLAFSMASFATMTLENYQKARHLIFIVSSEALIGILTLGMFVSSFFAKIKDS